jgi:hypothetical protein
MRKRPFYLATWIASVAAWVVSPASAAGFGGGTAAVLGQPLAFVTQLRLDPGETLEPACVAAEVMAGERLLPASQVRTSIESQGEGGARIRVATTTSMDEPVIDIRLTVGCAIRVSRNFIVLVDPPEPSVAAAAAVAAAPVFAAAPAEAERFAQPQVMQAHAQAAVGVLQAAVAVAPSSADAAAPVAEAARTPPVAPRSAAPQSPPASRAETRAAPRPLPAAQRRAERAVPRNATAPSAGMQRVAAVEGPARLQLDFVESPPVAEVAAVELALEAVAEAASAARAQAAAASAAAARMAALERKIERLEGEARSSRDEAALLRAQMEEGTGTGNWLLPLTVLVLLLSALTAWLAWRLASLQRERRQHWHDALVPPPLATPAEPADPPSRQATSPIPFVTSEIKLPPPAAGGLRPGLSAWPPAVAADAWAPPARAVAAVAPAARVPGEQPMMERTEVQALPLRPDDSAPRDVSIEELIDLEQQAEFFVVLGQDDAAVDLLMQHLRDSGGGSPLPYLKLLEIHHRSGDRAAYERMRVRFNQRFNAYAPEWGADLKAGRSLEDYTGIVPRLQQVWARPMDAMAELEALLFRKSRGELFDLPAYREVLFLYALARDLLDHEVLDPHQVDLLLPLADGGEFSSTAPSPFMDMPPGGGAGRAKPDDRPTAPVDLDLSQAAPPTSIFDPRDESPRMPRP